jgi:hypothetical protein
MLGGDTVNDLMDICERIGCTIQELPSRMDEVELRLWLARCSVEPRTSPDRWYARILSAVTRGRTSSESLLRMRSRYETLTTSLADIRARARASANDIFSALKNLGK